GAKLSVLSQSELYKGIREHRPRAHRIRTERAMARALLAIEAMNGVSPHPSKLWANLKKRKHGTFTQKWCAFNWKALHDAHKIGEFWKHTPVRDRYMPCTACNEPVESLEHIVFECRMTNQETVWTLTKDLWRRTGMDFPETNIGTVLGISEIEIKRADGSTNRGLTRLFRILVSEAVYLIWLLRCEWRISREANPMRVHPATEVAARWRAIINRRLKMDWNLTNQAIFKKRALRKSLVEQTWNRLKLHETGITANLCEGVLVGSGIADRLPGRNR
ncbi:hypothetical protein DFP72DRAFT_830835, partial [Ephemerocybe angulata]